MGPLEYVLPCRPSVRHLFNLLAGIHAPIWSLTTIATSSSPLPRKKQHRLRKRSRQQSRKLSSVLTVPKDDKGDIIHLHTAAYNGEAPALSSYILQGGDLEVRAPARRSSECSTFIGRLGFRLLLLLLLLLRLLLLLPPPLSLEPKLIPQSVCLVFVDAEQGARNGMPPNSRYQHMAGHICSSVHRHLMRAPPRLARSLPAPPPWLYWATHRARFNRFATSSRLLLSCCAPSGDTPRWWSRCCPPGRTRAAWTRTAIAPSTSRPSTVGRTWSSSCCRWTLT